MTQSGESRNCDQSPDNGRGNLGSVNTPVLTMHRDRIARKQIKVHLDFLDGISKSFPTVFFPFRNTDTVDGIVVNDANSFSMRENG